MQTTPQAADVISSCRLVKLFSLNLAYLLELPEVRNSEKVVRYDGRNMDHRSLESDEKSSSLQEAHAKDLCHESVERKVLVEIDSRQNSLDLWKTRTLSKDRDDIANQG